MPDPDAQLKRLYQQILAGVAPSDAANASGSIAAMIKYLVANGGSTRKHVYKAQDWGLEPGSDFWLLPAVNGSPTAGNAHEIIDHGWAGTYAVTQDLTGDFLSAADPGRQDFGPNTGGFVSPVIFGNYGHALQAAEFLGSMPTKLIAEWWGRWSVASANETQAAIGFHNTVTWNGASAANHIAMIHSNAVNFRLGSSGATDTGAAIDTSDHLWRIQLTGSTAEWFIDGVSQGTIALLTDVFPCAFALGMAGGGTNKPKAEWIHIWYE